MFALADRVTGIDVGSRATSAVVAGPSSLRENQLFCLSLDQNVLGKLELVTTLEIQQRDASESDVGRRIAPGNFRGRELRRA
jgi:hypothetical protein